MKRQRNSRTRLNYLWWMNWYRFRSKEQAFPYGQRGVSASKMPKQLSLFRKVR